CRFAEDTFDAKGKGTEKLPSTASHDAPREAGLAARCRHLLKPGTTPAQLPAEATRLTDHQAAQQLNEARGPVIPARCPMPQLLPSFTPKPLLESTSVC
ncbi:MAG: hypothetical protein ACREXU_09740, partial [Gammaproteobacteria bacterium]